MRRGIPIILSGFSGAGKGTVIKELMNRHPGFSFSVSATTRKPRVGETHGVDYYFISDEEFEDRIRNGQFLEHAGYVGHYYGSPKAFVEEELAKGNHVIFDIEVQGAMQLKRIYPEAILIFLTCPSMAELKRRLIERGTNSAVDIEGRLARAKEEAKSMDRYQYILINDVASECADRMYTIVRGEENRLTRNLDFVRKTQKEAEEL